MESLRRSGLDVIGEISWGTHISLFYSSIDNLKRVIVPYIKAGLNDNEVCIWIYSQNISSDEIIYILKDSVDNIDAFIGKKQLILVPYTEWYIKDGSFNEERVNQKWVDLINFAQLNGYEGLRAVADVAWLNKYFYDDFMKYESRVNNVITQLRFTAICMYDENKVSIPQVADIVNNHFYTLFVNENDLKLIKNAQLIAKDQMLEDSKRLLNEIIKNDKLKTEFFSNISHELRTPLNVILSAIQLIKKMKSKLNNDCIDPKESKYLKIIQQNCYRQLRLINNLIDITKLDSNYYELHLQNCNIVEVIQDITMSVKEFSESRGIKLSFESNVNERIMTCDPDRIERIILNLLSNAIKYTKPGGYIKVSVMLSCDKIIIIVKDTGVGIPEDKLPTIFDRFKQVDTALNREQIGSGIGLSLVKSLVEKHNGQIRVKSKEGVGTEFFIELPCKVNYEINSTPVQSAPSYQSNVEKINIEFADIYTVV